MEYDLTKFAHALIGTLALISFWTAGFSKKGSPIHRASGKIYLIAMCGILLTGFPMAAMIYFRGHPVSSVFLAYLLIITASVMWTSWRAIKDKQNFAAYTGPVYRGLMLLNGASGVIVLILGLTFKVGLLTGFSFVGIFAAFGMWRTMARGPEHSLWWRDEHIDSMLGNAIATHIAFLSIGLPKILPMLSGPALQNLAWFGPIAVALAVRFLIKRRYTPGRSLRMQTA